MIIDKELKRQKEKEWRQERKKLGLCRQCTNFTENNSTFCVICKEKNKELKNKKKNNNICIKGGCHNTTNGTSYCESCNLIQKNTYIDKKLNNICIKCTNEAEENSVLCLVCSEKNKIKYNIKKSSSLCQNCSKPAKKQFCDKCLEIKKIKKKQYKKQRKNNGICQNCSNLTINGFTYCSNCKITQSIYYKIRSQKKKENGICLHCINKAIEFSSYCLDCWFKHACSDNTKTVILWEKLKELFYKQNELCVYSNEKLIPGVNASIDHIIPKTKGGTNDISNLQWVTRKININKNDLTHDEFVKLCTKVCLKFNPKLK